MQWAWPSCSHASACSLEEVLNPCEVLNNKCRFHVLVNFQINKAFVGSGCGDVPKYVGEGVALHGLSVESGRPNSGQRGAAIYLNE